MGRVQKTKNKLYSLEMVREGLLEEQTAEESSRSSWCLKKKKKVCLLETTQAKPGATMETRSDLIGMQLWCPEDGEEE